METVVILGGGPCGLSAAWELSGTGKKVVVVEAQSSPGGLCKTIGYRGFNFDLGGHRFISKNDELINKIKVLMGDDLLVSERVSAIRLNGREFQYPLSAGDILKQTDIMFLARCLVDYVYQALYKRLNIMALSATDLPEPVVPATSKCGILARFATTGRPEMLLPSARVRGCVDLS